MRDANEIKIEVNVGAKSRAVFNLTYEELLVRRKGRYELVINVDPQEVRVTHSFERKSYNLVKRN